jgi:Asp-tRNA(Asn)/Glu-tRNA(Gln) amidotransferase B subunit
MDIKKHIEDISALVGSDNLKEAINLLQKLLKTSPKLDDAILQSARLTDLMRQIRNGTISFDDADISKNKIRLAILSLADEIEELVLSHKSLQDELDENLTADSSPKIIQQFHSGPGDNVAGNKIVNGPT